MQLCARHLRKSKQYDMDYNLSEEHRMRVNLE